MEATGETGSPILEDTGFVTEEKAETEATSRLGIWQDTGEMEDVDTTGAVAVMEEIASIAARQGMVETGAVGSSQAMGATVETRISEGKEEMAGMAVILRSERPKEVNISSNSVA